jgi:hypothetical protein
MFFGKVNLDTPFVPIPSELRLDEVNMKKNQSHGKLKRPL